MKWEGSIAEICKPHHRRKLWAVKAGVGIFIGTASVASTASAQPQPTPYLEAMQLKRSQRCDMALPLFNVAMHAARSGQDRELELKVLRHRGECCQYQGDYALAWLDLAYGRSLAPEKALFYEALGWLAIFEGHYSMAQNHLKQAQRLEPDNPWVQLNLGWSYYLQGDIAPAFTLWEPLIQSPQSIYRQALQRETTLLQKRHAGASQHTFEAVKQLLIHTDSE